MTQGRKPAGAARVLPPPELRSSYDTDPDQTATDETTKVGPMTALIAEMMLQEEEVEDLTPQLRAHDDAATLRAARTVHVSPSSHPPPSYRADAQRFPSHRPLPNFGSERPPAYVAPAMREVMPTPPRTVPVSSFPPANTLTTEDELLLMRRRRAPIFIVVGAVLLIGGGIALALTILQ